MVPGPRHLWKRCGLASVVVALFAGLLLGLFEMFRRPPGVIVLFVLVLVLGVGIVGVIDTTAHHRAEGDSWLRAVVHGIGDGVPFIFDALP
jgi:hypothetical protein